MADNVISNLSIQVESNAKNAVSALDQLASTLMRVKGTMRRFDASNVINSIKQIKSNASSAATALNRMAAAQERVNRAMGGFTGGNYSATMRGVERSTNAASESISNFMVVLAKAQTAMQRMDFSNAFSARQPQLTGQPLLTGQTQEPIYTDFVDNVDDIQDGMETVESSTRTARVSLDAFFASLRNISISAAFKDIGTGLKGIGKALFAIPTYFGKQLVGNISESVKGMGQFLASIKRIAMYRLIRTALKEITKGISEGIKHLYNWSKTADGTFAASMNRIATASQYMGNSFAAMVSPLINALSPAIDFIADKFVDLFNLINQIFARLAGQTSYTAAKKVAAQWDDASKKTKKSANDLKRTILGFDEINKLNDPSSGSGGSGGSGSSGAGMFETLPIEGSVSSFADQLKAAFEASNWQELGTLLGNKINEIVDGIDWAGAGQKVGYYVNGWFSTKYWTLETINFENIGAKIAEFLNNAIEQINFNTLGRLAVQKLTIVGDLIVGFFMNFDWGQYASKMSNFVSGIFDQLSKWIEKQKWEDIGLAIVYNLIDLFKGIDFSGITSSIAEFLGAAFGGVSNLLGGILEGLWENIVSAVNSTLDYFSENIEACGGNFIQGILLGIAKGVMNIGAWIVENVFTPFINGFKKAFGITGDSSSEMEGSGLSIILGILAGIVNGMKNIATWVNDNILKPIGDAITDAGEVVVTIAVSLIKNAKEWASDVWTAIKAGAEIIGKTVQASFTAIGQWIGDKWAAVQRGAETIEKSVKASFSAIGQWIGDKWAAVQRGAETIEKAVKATFSAIGQWVGDKWAAVQAGAETITKAIHATFSAVGQWVGDKWAAVQAGAETISKAIHATFSAVGNWIGDQWAAVQRGAETISKAIHATFSSVGNWIEDKWNAVKTGAETITKTIEAKFSAIGDWIADKWEFVKSAFAPGAENIVTKTVKAGIEKLSSWVDSIVDFFLGPDSTDKKANFALAIENSALSILNFVSNPVTAVKNVLLELGVKFAKGVEKFWNWITGQDGESEVIVDAYGNFMIVPKAGPGLTDNGDGTMSLDDPIAGTTVLTPAPDWQEEWDEFLGHPFETDVELNFVKGKIEKGLQFLLDNPGKPIVTTVSTALKKANTWIADAWTALTKKENKPTTTTKLTKATGNNWRTEAWTALTKKSNTVQSFTKLFKAKTWSGDAWTATTKKSNTVQSFTKLSKAKTWSGNAWTAATKVSNVVQAFTKLSKANSWSGDAWTATTKKSNTVQSFTKLFKGSNWSDKAWTALTKKKNEPKSTTSLYQDGKNWSSSAYTVITTPKERSVAIKVGLKPDSTRDRLKFSYGYDGVKVEVDRALGGVFLNGSWSSIPQYANGTTNAGSMFIAGEAGPELVGHIGGRTEVLNRSQLAATMYSAVKNAMSGVTLDANFYGMSDSGEADYDTMYQAMYDAFTAALSKSEERDREKVALLRSINSKDYNPEITAASIAQGMSRMNRRAGTTVVAVSG